MRSYREWVEMQKRRGSVIFVKQSTLGMGLPTGRRGVSLMAWARSILTFPEHSPVAGNVTDLQKPPTLGVSES